MNNGQLFDPSELDPKPKPWQTTAGRNEMEREAKARKEAAITLVDANALEAWKDAADEAITWCALRYRSFTADDVWWRLEDLRVESPHEKRAMGPRMLRAAKLRVIESTGQPVKSKRPVAHQEFLSEWRSLIYTGSDGEGARLG